MRILIIDNTIEPDSWGSEPLRRFGRLYPGATLHVRRAPHDDLPRDPGGFDRIVASGSLTGAADEAPWIDRLLEFIRRAVDMKKPYLGVCYGHQALVRALGGKSSVRKAETPEFGWTRIQVVENSPLTRNLPPEFYSFSSHFDEVAELPPGMRKLARSADCEIQACQLGELPVFGIQFHPEKNAEDAEKVFADRREKGTPKRLLHPGKSAKLYDSRLSQSLFRNFFEL